MLLISGGCDCVGKVVLNSKVKKLISMAKLFNYVIAHHVLVVDDNYVKKLRDLGIDIILIDIDVDYDVLTHVRNLRVYKDV